MDPLGLSLENFNALGMFREKERGQSIDAFSFASPAVVAYFNEVQVGGGAATSLFDELDKNGDGTITPKEFNPGPARGANGQTGEPARRRGPGQ